MKLPRIPYNGFTLIEMALILILFGVILSTTLPKMLSDIKTDTARKSKNSVQEARDEIIGYALANNQLPAADGGASPVVPTTIKSRFDAWGQGITYILPNVNATNGALWTNDICAHAETNLSITTPGGTTDEVAFVVASKGMDQQGDVVYDAAGTSGTARTVTTQAFGAGAPPDEFDDIAEFVTFEYLKNQFSCSDTTPTPPGSPAATFPFDNLTDPNLTPNGGVGTVTSAVAGGGIGEVLALDGTNDSVQVTNSAAYALDQFTILGWFKTTDLSLSDFQLIIGRQLAVNTRNFWITLWGPGAGAQTHVTGEVAFKASPKNDPGNHYQVDTDAETSYNVAGYHSDGEWHFFAMNMVEPTGANDPDLPHTGTMYVSGDISLDLNKTPTGQPDATKNSGPSTAGAQTLYIGVEPSTNRYFQGYIDELKVYSTPLTETQIGQWYNSTRPYYN